MINDIPDSHPRAASLRMRHTIEKYRTEGLVADAGPIAHGRGEAFDYILGEETIKPVYDDIIFAAALLVLAKHPVISINGNAAVLVPEEIISLSNAIPAKMEVNVFYGRTGVREKKIADHLYSSGAKEVLGVNPEAKIPNLFSARGNVDKNGIAIADVVLVMLEDGDRTKALIDCGKKVISIDLNPLSRSAKDATVNICDNITRALPLLEKHVNLLKNDTKKCNSVINSFSKKKSESNIFKYIEQRFAQLAKECLTNE